MSGATKRASSTSNERQSRKSLNGNTTQTHELYPQVFQQLAAAVYTCNAKGEITSFNQKALQLWGRTPEIGKDLWCGSLKIYSPDGTPLALTDCPMAIALRDRRPVRGQEIIVERPDGKRVPVLPHPDPLFDEKGELVGAVNLLIDLTGLRRTEDALRASEKRQQQLLSLMPAAVYTCDHEGRITYYNKRAAELWKQEPPTNGDHWKFCAAYKCWFNGHVIPPDKTPMATAVREGKGFRDLEPIFERPDGSRFNALVNIDPIWDERGEPAGALNVFQDVTALKQAQTAACESEEQLRKLISLMPAAVYTCDAEGRITFFNRRAAELWGRQPALGDCDDRFCGSFRLWLPDGSVLSHDQTPMAQAVRSGMVTRDAEVVIERPDGSRVTVCVNIDPLFDAHGHLRGAINVFQDITQRKKMEAALLQKQEQLETELAHTKLLHEVSATFVAEENVEELYNKILEAAIAMANSDMGCMQVLDPLENTLQLLAHKGFGVHASEFLDLCKVESGTCCNAAKRAGQRVIVADVEDCEFMAGTPALAVFRKIGVRAVQSTPLFSRTGQLVGMLTTQWRHPHQPSERVLRFLDILARQAADLLERRRANEEALEMNLAMTHAMPGISILTPEGRYAKANPAYAQMTGYEPSEMIGMDWTPTVHPNDREAALAAYRRMVEKGFGEAECTGVRKDGSTFVKHVALIKRVDRHGRFIGHYCFMKDISERKRGETLLLRQKEILELIANDVPLLDVMEKVISVMEEHSPGLIGTVLLLDEDGVHLRPFAGKQAPAGWSKLINPLRIGPCAGACGTAAYRNEPVIVEDICTDPLWAAFKEEAVGFGLRACWSTPIRSNKGHVLGTFAVYYREPRKPTDLEWNVVAILAQTAALAIERQQATEARQKLTALVEHSPNFVGVADLNQRAIYLNPAGRALVDIKAEDVPHSKILDYFPEEERVRVETEIMPLLLANGHWDGEVRFRNFSTGALIPMMWNVFIIPDAKTGAPAYFACVSTDITERKRGERLLHAQKRSLEMLVRGAPLNDVLSSLISNLEEQCEGTVASILLVDDDGRLRNGASSGLPDHYLRAVDGLKVQPELGTCSRAAALNEVVLTPDIENDQYWQSIKHLPLELGFFAAWSMPIVAKNGRVLGTFGTYFRQRREPTALERQIVDVLSRTAALAIEGKKAEQALRRSEELFRSLAESLPQIVWTARPDGHLDYYNKRWYEYTGFGEGEYGDESWKPILHPDDVQRTVETYYGCIREARLYQIEYRFKDRQNGGYRWFLGRALPLRDESGKVVRWFGTCTDIDDQKRAEEKLEKAVAERTASLRDAIAQMEEFSYTVSHDLRAPLRGMQVYTEALLGEFADVLPAEATHYLNRIAANSTRLDKMICDVLTFSRIARAELPLERVNITKLVRQIIEQYLGMQPPDTQIDVQPLEDVMGHEPSLTQAISNLLNNAIKFVAPNVKPQISLWTEKQNGYIRLWIADNGIGIKPEYQHRLFSMFERVHPDLKYDGTGVGLAIVRKAVERMGGKTGMESDGANGSRFWIELRAAN